MTGDAFDRTLAALADPRDDADWGDVLRRAGMRRRPWRTAALVLVAAVLVAGPALALQAGVVHVFSDAPPAPTPVVHDFRTYFAEGAPPGMETHVVPGETRKIASYRKANGGWTTLYVAPTRTGGYCELWTEQVGGCVQVRPPIAAFGGIHIAAGSVHAVRDATLELRYQDGAAAELPLTWVSKPIDAGFFYLSVPAEHRVPGHLPVALVLTGSDGKAIAREAGLFSFWRRPGETLPTGRPRGVDAGSVRVLIDGGDARLVSAPVRGEPCSWVEYQGHAFAASCGPPGEHPRLGFGSSVVLDGDRRVILLRGRTASNVERVVVTFEDGHRMVIPVVERRFLAELTAPNLAAGHRLARVRGLAADGRVVGRWDADPRSATFPTCALPYPLGGGLSVCP